ncbi:flavin reductase family protein [Salisediminibacterium halotolerans]|uniref:flavin reductase family protein n=1 Tax=Salisediminibacterium halotolerans TaxID=517425 RepID=UPI000EAE42F1|nr:flavin reductase family protein [Salisediminibacterium halotolerans]RLJ73274.1 flavin reductase (DIM6/NTAB) family NADH-FMN oxidoreductase RutF [Actinophytocola xinjiangensis]RPE86696.1 flavin reductase (DIM6/NTAB) family NADH-FMN oxidoreductase RutF [Salisediminibacterium halotolerans]TWG34071.1 flavin reductase (DIM6/NTAB) family NADH-FMN oxidoreductase RutF [Salisediminibacterium halotolerans]GEL07586.1 hypothetical protein SHA02_10020 [Salisediminibacterium halotolerans]
MLQPVNHIVMHTYPGLIALVTAKSGDTANVMAAGWHSYMSADPPIYGVAVAKERFTHHLIVESGAFAVNFVSADYTSLIDGSGKLSGYNGDKFHRIGSNWFPGEKTSAPIMNEAYIAYECEIIESRTYGDHDWVSGNITQFYQDKPSFFENGQPNFDKLKLPLFFGNSEYLIPDHETARKKMKDFT